jgi:hypothetical protein
MLALRQWTPMYSVALRVLEGTRGYSRGLHRETKSSSLTSAVMHLPADACSSGAWHAARISRETGLTPCAASAPGLGSPLPHLRRDRAHSKYLLCVGTGCTVATSAPGLGSPTPTSAPGLGGTCEMHAGGPSAKHSRSSTGGPAPLRVAALAGRRPPPHATAAVFHMSIHILCYERNRLAAWQRRRSSFRARGGGRYPGQGRTPPGARRRCGTDEPRSRARVGWGEPSCGRTKYLLRNENGKQRRHAWQQRLSRWGKWAGASPFSPGADVGGVSSVPAQMWAGQAQCVCRCGRGEPSAM